MMDTLENFDRFLFFLINSNNHPYADVFFDWVSYMPVWLPLYAWAIYFLYKKFKLKIWIAILFCIGLIFVSDQTCNFFKNSFKRNRPTHNVEIAQQVHTVNNYRGGQYGFVSGHSANTAAFFVFLLFLLKPLKKGMIFLLIFWVLLVGWSRIYLGVHYPFDVLGGYFVGLFYGILFAFIFNRFVSSTSSSFVENQSD